jgi:hypothetical protein
MSQPARGEERGNKLALVIVSGHGGYTPTELSKAISFRKYLLNNGFNNQDIRYLTPVQCNESHAISTKANVMESIQWLQQNSTSDTDVIIYISDHEQTVNGIIHFFFEGGNISAEQIDLWLEEVNCSSMNIFLNGPRSGLAGTDLTGINRSVYCSMKGYQDYDPDRFNITRSLQDPAADKDHNGDITYLEAFEMEKIRLLGTGQEPVKYI